MEKAEALTRWRSTPEGQDPLAHMRPIPYKAKGSKYGACGIRIDGNPEFVDAVLSRLTPLLAGENSATRLGLSRNPVKATEVKGQVKGFANRDGEEAEVVYIRLHMRGDEGAIAASVLGVPGTSRKQVHDNTRQFALAIGVDPDEE